jgi:hypothetical protein
MIRGRPVSLRSECLKPESMRSRFSTKASMNNPPLSAGYSEEKVIKEGVRKASNYLK